MSDDRRLIEDFLPIQSISAEASRESVLRTCNPVVYLSYAKRKIVALRFYEVTAEANKAAASLMEKGGDE